MPVLETPDEKPINAGLWDFVTKVDGMTAERKSDFFDASKKFEEALRHLQHMHDVLVKRYRKNEADGSVSDDFAKWAEEDEPLYLEAIEDFQTCLGTVKREGEWAYQDAYEKALTEGYSKSLAQADKDNLYFI